MLATGRPVTRADATPPRFADWPDDLAEIVYIDPYGNCMTGIRAATLPPGARLNGLARARTFSDAPEGEAFWYENANGLAEIAVNRGSAAARLGLKLGDRVDQQR
jgi:S-adenosylmethionine hydrolase